MVVYAGGGERHAVREMENMWKSECKSVSGSENANENENEIARGIERCRANDPQERGQQRASELERRRSGKVL